MIRPPNTTWLNEWWRHGAAVADHAVAVSTNKGSCCQILSLCQCMCLYVTYWVLWNTTVTQYRILCHTNSPANAEREGESSWLVTPVPRTLSGSWNLTCARCQHQATATNACNWSSVISWPSRWSPVSFCHLCRPKSCQYNVDILFLLSRPRRLCLLIIRDAARLRITKYRPIQFM